MNEDPDEMLERAAVLEEQGEAAEALKLLQRAAEIFPNDPVILTRIGSLATKLVQWPEAEAALLRAIELDRDFAPAYLFLGLLYRDEDRRDAALDIMTSAVRLEESAGNLTVLGVTQLAVELIEEARQSLRRALCIDPNYEEALYNLATTLTVDNPSEAIELFEKAIEIDPLYTLAHRELGWVLRRVEKYAEAEYHLRRAIELDSTDGWAYIYLGNLMWTIEDQQAAERFFEEAIRVWPDQSTPYWCLGHLFEVEGDQQQAEQLYAKALAIDPADAQANYRFGSYLADVGDVERAKQHLTWATELDPSDKRASAKLATLE